MVKKLLCLLLLAVAGILSVPVSAQEATAQGTARSWLPSLTSYFQERYTDYENQDDEWSLRRFKLLLDGDASERITYHVQLFYKTNNNSGTDDKVYLKDALITFHASERSSVSVGRFKPPFGLERFQHDNVMDFMERTSVTNRLVVNGKLGSSFARDQGIQADFKNGHSRLSVGLFEGGGANNAGKGNGPLGVARLIYKRAWKGGRWSKSLLCGGAVSLRHAGDLDLHSALPGVSTSITGHFAGTDRRANLFARGELGPFSGQVEGIRLWLSPHNAGEIAALGTYGQLTYRPVSKVLLGVRYERVHSDIHDNTVPVQWTWTYSVTSDLNNHLRLALDYSRSPSGRFLTPPNTWRFQVQYVLFRHLSPWTPPRRKRQEQ